MIVKDGFLLLELLISFTLLCFLLFIIAHYIIEIKNIQHEVLTRAHMLSIARNIVETTSTEHVQRLPPTEKEYIVSIKENQESSIKTVMVEKKINDNKR